MRPRRLAALAISFTALGACGASDPTEDAAADIAVAVSEPTSTTEPEASPPEQEGVVQDVAELLGIWIPVEVGGETVDAAAVGAYLQILPAAETVRIIGFDGCNGHGGTASGAGPTLQDGRFVAIEFGQEAAGCGDFDSVAISPGNDAVLSVSDDGNELFADGVTFVETIRYRRAESVPVDPRIAIAEAEQAAEDEAQQAEEAAERAAFDEAEAQAREQIRTELPDARSRWEAAGIGSYTLRFENGALRNDPSFPTTRPVGGVWEIEVVDGVAAENDWSESILGDTVEDWFAYVESQLDSHYLNVTFDPDLGFPSTIDSQPLDDMVVDDPNSIVAWIVFAEIEPAS